ncbi:hypothetical protein [Halobaculum roseum]|uniref:Uncharacterized protein n=1 Tax=Halobaculum roseum TaxID=2175149 RepID=A0ABD5MMU9_9EURY|nr:hypothetical protein [Halobaculum roseum]QZY04237.1 hypothetical protein K6T36_16120 [Halobaculum roseum]
MASGDLTYGQSVFLVLRELFSEYNQTDLGPGVITLSTIIYWGSSTLSAGLLKTSVRLAIVGLALGSFGYVYVSERPFGVDISWTPTHIVDGTRSPDKMSETRGNALIQQSSTLIHGEIQFSKFTNGFDFQVETSSELSAEFESIPRREHDYDPESNRLKCQNMSERSFPIKLEVYPRSTAREVGRYHSLQLVDVETESVLMDVDVIDVRG